MMSSNLDGTDLREVFFQRASKFVGISAYTVSGVFSIILIIFSQNQRCLNVFFRAKCKFRAKCHVTYVTKRHSKYPVPPSHITHAHS